MKEWIMPMILALLKLILILSGTYLLGRIIMKAWICEIEHHILNKFKNKKDEKEEKK